MSLSTLSFLSYTPNFNKHTYDMKRVMIFNRVFTQREIHLVNLFKVKKKISTSTSSLCRGIRAKARAAAKAEAETYFEEKTPVNDEDDVCFGNFEKITSQDFNRFIR